MYGSDTVPEDLERTAFRKAEKKYKLYYEDTYKTPKKKKKPKPVDLSEVLDFKSILESYDQNAELPPGIVPVRCGLDRPVFCLENRPATELDHKPVLVDSDFNEDKSPKQFKFEAQWLSREDCKQVVEECWNKSHEGPWDRQLIDKLEDCQTNLQAWSHKHFPNNRRQIDSLLHKLAVEQNNPRQSVNSGKIQNIISQLDDHWLKDELYWLQRSGINSLTAGDGNSMFFHLSTRRRRQRNRISRLKNQHGVWLKERKEIKQEIMGYFQNLFTTDGPRCWDESLACVNPIVTDEMNEALLQPVSVDEVKSAVFQLGALKSSGPDGFPGLFYQHFWEIINGVIQKVASTFYKNGSILKEMNMTRVTLIPKVRNPEYITQFRPISCCNFSYKILSKILANRLKTIIPDIISPAQCAFVPQRQIQDNILIAHEAFHYLKLKKDTCYELGLKVDMNKAFDRIEWDFLKAVMLKMGFDPRWVDLIMECVQSVSLSIMINGSPSSPFTPTRGLRQGDPLSSYLFILVSEVLSSMIQKSCDSGNLKGIKFFKAGPSISHLFFADDSLFFLNATDHNCREMIKILDSYCKASGQRVNYNKSSLYFSPNTPDHIRAQLSDILMVEATKNPGKYLGLPTIWGKSKRQSLAYVRDNIFRKIEGWNQCILSPAGSEVLIKSVASAVPVYPMTIFKFPKTLCQEINSEIARFWWSQQEDESRIHWISWDKMGRSKKQGGMGFRDFEDFNLALLAKQAWRLLQDPEALWARVLKGLYFPSSTIMEARRGSRSSWAWSSILEGRDLLAKGAQWQINNGETVNIWQDNWIPGFSEGLPLPVLEDNFELPDRVNELIHWDTRTWDLTPIRPFLTVEQVKAIEELPFGSRSRRDKLVWPWEKSGRYSVRSGYHLTHNKCPISTPNHTQSSHQIDPKVWNLIWSMNTLPKVKQLFWRMVSNAVPTRWNLFQRRLLIDPICPICNEHPETIEHVLLLCPWVDIVWFGCMLGYRVDKTKVTTIDNWLLDLSQNLGGSGGVDAAAITLVSFVCWTIWKARCKWVFESAKLEPVSIVSKAVATSGEFLNANKKSSVPCDQSRKNSTARERTKQWHPPSHPMVKINTDGAWNNELRVAGLGVVARNHRGELFAGMNATVPSSSPLVAEALSLREGVEMAKNLNFRHVEFESDSEVLIRSITGAIHEPPLEIQMLVHQIQDTALNFTEVRWSSVDHQANRAADWVASLSKRKKCPLSWVNSPPSPLVEILVFDGLSTPSDFV